MSYSTWYHTLRIRLGGNSLWSSRRNQYLGRERKEGHTCPYLWSFTSNQGLLYQEPNTSIVFVHRRSIPRNPSSHTNIRITVGFLQVWASLKRTTWLLRMVVFYRQLCWSEKASTFSSQVLRGWLRFLQPRSRATCPASKLWGRAVILAPAVVSLGWFAYGRTGTHAFEGELVGNLSQVISGN